MFLRPGGACDPDSLATLFAGCDADPYHLPVPDPAFSLSNWMAQLRHCAQAGSSYCWIIEFPQHRPVGSIRIGHINVRRKSAQLSYWIAPEHRRRGYATAAGRLALGFVFSSTPVSRIDTWIEAHNIASHRVAEKLGFRRVAATSARNPISAYRLLACDFPSFSGDPMLTIRDQQLDAFRAVEFDSFVRHCVSTAEQRFPGIVEALPGGRKEAMACAEAAASRATALGFRQPAEIRAFIYFALCIGPHFDLYPKVRELLSAPGLDPGQRLASLEEFLTTADWENAARHRAHVSA
ncbi:MAG: GNAT family N-acetyltransferase [Acidobacteria bacterium]|nr:GNAT family N-acetyltransferase [Acidobacteriota bacterium]